MGVFIVRAVFIVVSALVNFICKLETSILATSAELLSFLNEMTRVKTFMQVKMMQNRLGRGRKGCLCRAQGHCCSCSPVKDCWPFLPGPSWVTIHSDRRWDGGVPGFLTRCRTCPLKDLTLKDSYEVPCHWACEQWYCRQDVAGENPHPESFSFHYLPNILLHGSLKSSWNASFVVSYKDRITVGRASTPCFIKVHLSLMHFLRKHREIVFSSIYKYCVKQCSIQLVLLSLQIWYCKVLHVLTTQGC